MDAILQIVRNTNIVVTKDIVKKARDLSAEEFAILVIECRRASVGYEGLSRLFDMRSNFGTYERAAIEAMSFDVEFNSDGQTRWPLTEYILQTLDIIKPGSLLKEAAFANHLLTPVALKRRLDYFGIDSSSSFSRINDHVNTSHVPTRAGVFKLKRNVFSKKPKWVIKSDESDLVKKMRSKLPPRRKDSISLDKTAEKALETLTEEARTDNLINQDMLRNIKDYERIDDEVEEAMTKIDNYEKDDAYNISIYGPLNGTTWCPTGVGDGHRMLRCVCCELGSNTDMYSWFTGICDACGNKIRRVSHAIRFPNTQGCFTGCYCSFQCMEEYPVEEIDDIVEYKMDSLKVMLETYKIYA